MPGTKQSGRRKEPTALAEVTGTPYKPAPNRDEPRPDRGLPPVPRWLPDEARADWDYYAAVLDKAGVITVADGAILGALCVALWEIDDCTAALKANRDRTDPVCKRISTMLNLTTLRMIRLAASLGLEPSSRAGLYTGGGAGEERSAMEEFQLEGERRQERLRIVGA